MEMIELLPSHVPDLVKFQTVSVESLDAMCRDGTFAIGDFTRGDQLAWVAKGACIEVLNSKNATRVGSWSFGSIMKEANTNITCVVEFRYRWETLLLIGLSSRGTGMLCTFDPHKSKIISAIDLPSKVVSLEMISQTQLTSSVVIRYLHSFSGVVAVGMDSGIVYLLDLCLDRPVYSTETQPAKVNAIPASTPDVKSIYDNLEDDEHIAIILDHSCCARGSYLYCRPDGKTLQSFNASDVCVTAIKYIPQIGSLIIGMNFGCFQIWKMDRLMLEYSSPYEADLAPITNFVYQEPENDPKKFVYVWIGRGPTFVDKRDGDCAALSLYQFAYDNKKVIPGHGLLYSSMHSVTHRFEHPLTTDPYNVNGLSNVSGSTLISCDVITDAAYQHVIRREDGIDDYTSDLSLCAFLWEATSDIDPSKATYLLGLFDLNRWYHAQMPASVKPGHLSHGVCPFFAFCNLEDIVELSGPESVLSAQVCKESVTRYKTITTPAPEQHFYPSALAFDLCCLMEYSMVLIHFSGVQKQILCDLRRNNPSSLIEPTDLFNNCSSAEIMPKYCEASNDLSVGEQREALLSICVENAMTDVILNCISTWADGEYSRSGCTLRVVLNAAWTRVVKAKETVDKTCVPLFDCSVTGIDRQTINQLHHQESELGRLLRVFQQLLNLAGTTTEQGVMDLQMKLNVTSLLHEYMQVLTWLIVTGLLPETMEGDDTTGKYNYPATSLSQAFTLRRQELNSLHRDMTFSDLLMIDGLIDHVGGALKDQWSKEGGNGLYPPPSLHAVLSIYLLDDVPITVKHCVLAYLLLDLISLVADDGNQKLVQDCSLFAQCFGLTPSVARLVQGFWLLDHRDFTEALHVLLDPIITNADLAPWQHTRIIKALLYQGEARGALAYINTRHRNPSTPEDVKLKLTVLLASGNINQAFQFQRSCRDSYNTQDMIAHFFTGCMQTKNLGKVLKLPLDDVEDQHLSQFLRNDPNPESLELLVMYYLQRCRYIDAIRLHEEMKNSNVVDTHPASVQRAIARDSIIEAHIRNLPEVQRALISTKKPGFTPGPERIQVDRPKPLSTVVYNNRDSRVTSRATLICAVMEKVKEVQQVIEEDEPADPTEAEIEPFVSIPSTPKPKPQNLNESVVQQPVSEDKETGIFGTREPGAKSPLAKITDSAKKRMQKYQNAQAMSLLATPPVRRVTRSRIRPQPTPQSILKVRNTVRNNSPLVKPKRAEDRDNETPPARRNPFVSVSGSPHALKPGTPKLLRFVLSPSRSSTQITKTSTETSPEQREKSPVKSTQNDVTQIEVDEEITFNFSVSQLKHLDDKMETDDKDSCPSTASEAGGDLTPESSPKQLKSSKTPSSKTPTAKAKLETPVTSSMDIDTSERSSKFSVSKKAELVERMPSDEEKDTDESPVPVRESPAYESPYKPAKDLLSAFRAEYKPLIPEEDHPLDRVTPLKQAESSDISETDDVETEEITESTTEPEEPKRESLSRAAFQPSTKTKRTPARNEEQAEMQTDKEFQDISTKVETSVRKLVEVSQSVEKDIHREGRVSPMRRTSPLRYTPPDLTPEEESTESETDGRHSPPRLSPQSSMEPHDLSPEPEPLEPSPQARELSPEPREPSPQPRETSSKTRVRSSKPRDRTPEQEPQSAPRRSPRIAKRQSLTPPRDSPESESSRSSRDHSRQTSPLSSGSFMMKLRHTPRGSREPTPEASSRATDEPIKFTFSDPVTLQTDSEPIGSTTPLPRPFIFSPPVTRSKIKRRDSEHNKSLRSSVLDPGPISMSGLLDASVSDTVFETSLTKSSKKSRRKISINASSDSPINFVSPVARDSGNETKSDTNLQSGGSKLPHKMTLRSRYRVARPERKSYRLTKD